MAFEGEEFVSFQAHSASLSSPPPGCENSRLRETSTPTRPASANLYTVIYEEAQKHLLGDQHVVTQEV